VHGGKCAGEHPTTFGGFIGQEKNEEIKSIFRDFLTYHGDNGSSRNSASMTAQNTPSVGSVPLPAPDPTNPGRPEDSVTATHSLPHEQSSEQRSRSPGHTPFGSLLCITPTRSQSPQHTSFGLPISTTLTARHTMSPRATPTFSLAPGLDLAAPQESLLLDEPAHIAAAGAQHTVCNTIMRTKLPD